MGHLICDKMYVSLRRRVVLSELTMKPRCEGPLSVVLRLAIFPYNSLYTQAVAYTTYFELGEPVSYPELALFIHFRCNCACSVNGQRNVELKQCFSEVFVFVPLDKVTKAEETEYQSEFREARTSGIRPAQRS